MVIKTLSKYEVLMDALKKDISAGKYALGDRIPSEHELAGRFGVNRLTVNRAVNELVRENMLCRRQGMGTYVTNGFIESEKKGVGTTIHFFVPTLENNFFSTMAHHASRVVGEAGDMDMRIHNIQFDARREEALVAELLKDEKNRMFMVGFKSPATRTMIKKNPDRFVIFGHAPELEGRAAMVLTDLEEGGRMAANFMLGKGHKRLAFIGEARPTEPGKLSGCVAAMRAAGARPDESLFLDLDGYEEMDNPGKKRFAERCFERLRSSPRPPTAVFCSCDDLAFHYIMTCYERGLKIPRDMSICGFDGSGGDLLDAMRLTTVRQNYEKIMEAALSLVREGAPLRPLTLLIKPELVEGGTVAAPGKQTR